MNRPIRVLAALGLALSAFAIAGCEREGQSPSIESPQGKGSARIAMPSLPPGYAPAGQKALFALTVTGDGMDPIRKTWILDSEARNEVLVEGIPVGKPRHFEGKLIRIDTAAGDTVVTHEGIAMTSISREWVAQVSLVLRMSGGKARVCVEVEGWTRDTDCFTPPDTVPVDVNGCWALRVHTEGKTLDASLRIRVDGNLAVGYLHWADGMMDSAFGEIMPKTGVYLGTKGGQFLFKAMLLNDGMLTGAFIAKHRGIGNGFAEGTRSACSIDPDPYGTACFTFKHAAQAKPDSGRLAFRMLGKGQAGTWIRWHGLGFGYSISEMVIGSPVDTGLIKVPFSPPAGLFPKELAVDSAMYFITFAPQSASGSIHQLGAPKDGFHLGNWVGKRTACLEGDFKP